MLKTLSSSVASGRGFLFADGDAIRFASWPEGHVVTVAGSVSNPGFIDGGRGGIGAAGASAAEQQRAEADNKLNRPSSLCFDPDGNLLIADENNSAIRRLTPGAARSTYADFEPVQAKPTVAGAAATAARSGALRSDEANGGEPRGPALAPGHARDADQPGGPDQEAMEGRSVRVLKSCDARKRWVRVGLLRRRGVRREPCTGKRLPVLPLSERSLPAGRRAQRAGEREPQLAAAAHAPRLERGSGAVRSPPKAVAAADQRARAPGRRGIGRALATLEEAAEASREAQEGALRDVMGRLFEDQTVAGREGCSALLPPPRAPDANGGGGVCGEATGGGGEVEEEE